MSKRNDFSFGFVHLPTGNGRAWLDEVRAAEQQGWTCLLVPDTLWTPSPFPTLAAAGAVTQSLRLRTWVIAAPLRSPAAVVREVNALQLLSGGRFELGIGAGRPDAEREAGLLRVPWGTAADRIHQVEKVVATVREQGGPATPITVTGSGPRMLATAARIADRVGLALQPTASELDLKVAVDRIRSAHPGPIGLTLQVAGIAGTLTGWLAHSGLDAKTLTDSGAIGMLSGDSAAMADTIHRWQAQFGIDEILVPGELAGKFAPVIRRMTA